ncbi:MAG: class I adenylate-forming enzyme family protein [Pseudohongiellaceae bacterium]|nr:class I adenylate-forming enzyme family protein [Pseudohongiellaceae bacterium]
MNILDPIQHHADTMPDAKAIILPAGTMTWAQLNGLIEGAAVEFRTQGIQPGQLVGLSVDNPILNLLASLGLAKIAALQVALPPYDTRKERAAACQLLGVDCVVCDSNSSDFLQLPIIKFNNIPKPSSSNTKLPDGQATAEDPWMLVRSSGTTGEPKYAQISHRLSMERHRRWADAYDYKPDDVFWISLNLSTITGKQHSISALQAGTPLCLPYGLKSLIEIINFVKFCNTTLAYSIPSSLWNFAQLSNGELLLPKIRRFFSGTTELSEELAKEFKQKVTPNLYLNYGTNETPCVSVASPQLYDSVQNTVGIPHPLMEVQIVDDMLNELAIGETGQIRMRGPGTISCYFKNPAATSSSFKDGWFYPGDLAYFSQQKALVLQGRTDEMLIYDGMNIYPAEIERAMLSHPSIIEAVAFPISHSRYKELPAVAVRLKTSTSEKELLAWSQQQLGIKSPRKVFAVKEFPKNQSGKIMRRKLSELVNASLV